MAARQWTLEQRKQQSLKIRQWQPWKQSTGAKTNEGKETSSRNAFKGGWRAELKTLAKLLHEQRHKLRGLEP